MHVKEPLSCKRIVTSRAVRPTGPFKLLKAEDIDNEVSEMWRTMYKLTKTLSDQPGPRTIADRCKIKIDKFKQHLPLLHTICNPGIRDRHWDQMSDVMGFDIRPQEDSSLLQMLDHGLSKQLDKCVSPLLCLIDARHCTTQCFTALLDGYVQKKTTTAGISGIVACSARVGIHRATVF